jgi:alkanesulfonate monooxygenase SsuD/methylene tetrahydromethanopterin reductase-like flavin-dependent oxidoreductase (luciferase family)
MIGDMHVGMCCIFQGVGLTSDAEVYDADLALADAAEPLGFESIWTTEHHFTRYQICPDVMQFLTYMAGRTTTVQLGSAVAVLPWHDPLRLAEQVALLDTLSKGRVILGMGRGTGKIEFDGLRFYMGDARGYFKEAAEAIVDALETGYMEYDGEFVKQPRVALRPQPYGSFRGRVYSGTVSPESAEIMAKLGTGMLIVPQKPWHLVEKDCLTYRETYRTAIGEEPPPTICVGWTFVDDNEDRVAELAHRYLGEYWRTVVEHYEFDQPHLKDTPGYEFHGQMYDRLSKPGGMEEMTNFYVDLQPWGTPEQVYEKIRSFCAQTQAGSYAGVFRFGGMARDDGVRNMELFAREVMPELKKLPAFASTDGAEAVGAGTRQTDV